MQGSMSSQQWSSVSAGFWSSATTKLLELMVFAIQRIIGINYQIQNASKGVGYRGADFG
jgi:hypothetical protein